MKMAKNQVMDENLGGLTIVLDIPGILVLNISISEMRSIPPMPATS
jgi:hypothetical protein